MKTTNQTKTNFLKTASHSLILGLSFISADAFGRICQSNIAATTIYYIPHVRDFCPTEAPCERFRSAVRMQGSGTLTGNRLLTYRGRTIPLGTCETAFGASGECLQPFISVAADPRYYRMGDIIEMPHLRGQKITLSDNTEMDHPGYLRVADTGGAIKGKNRFDLFTGSMSMRNPMNDFGIRGPAETQMVDKNDCSSRKQFNVIRRNSRQYETSLAAIDEAVFHSRRQNVMLAGDLNNSGLGGIY